VERKRITCKTCRTQHERVRPRAQARSDDGCCCCTQSATSAGRPTIRFQQAPARRAGTGERSGPSSERADLRSGRSENGPFSERADLRSGRSQIYILSSKPNICTIWLLATLVPPSLSLRARRLRPVKLAGFSRTTLRPPSSLCPLDSPSSGALPLAQPVAVPPSSPWSAA